MVDLPDLPAPELEVLRFIIRQSGVSFSQVRDALPHFSEAELSEVLANLAKQGLVSVSEADDNPIYHPQLGRRAGRKTSLKGISAVLDFDQSEADTHPEIRRARSPLADQLLADLDQPITPLATAADDPETRRQGQALMADLLSTGRTAMAKRPLSDEPTPSEQPTSSGDADRLMSDLVAAGKSTAPKSETETPPSPAERRRFATVEFANIPRTPGDEEPVPQVAPAEVELVPIEPEEIPSTDEGLLGKVRKFFGLGSKK
jgi:hypothetical protein